MDCLVREIQVFLCLAWFLFFYYSETFVVFHQRNFFDDGHIDGDTELLMPEINDVLLYVRGVLLVNYQPEGDAAILSFDHLIGGNGLTCRTVVLLEETNEVVNSIALTIGVDITFAFSPHDALNFPISYFDKVLSVVTQERMCEIPEVCADYSSNTVGDGMIVIIKNFYDAVVIADMVAVMSWGLKGIWSTLATVRVNDITSESLLDFSTIGGRQSGASSHDMARAIMIATVTIAILCQQIKRYGVGADDGWVRTFYFVEDGHESIIIHGVERDIETVVYLVLQLFELSVAGSVCNLHVRVAKTVTSQVPGVEFGCGVDGISLFGDVK